MKSGTTSLHHYLEQYPIVSLPQIKETNFLNRYHSQMTIDEYEGLYDPACPIRGECCPQYSGCAEIIREVYPEAVILMLVRNPVSRLISHVRHNLWKGHSREAINHEIDALEGSYLHVGQYAGFIQRFEDAGFSPKVYSFSYLRDRPAGFFSSICTDIGLAYDPDMPPQHTHTSTGRPDFELTSSQLVRVKEYFKESNQWVADNYGIDLEIEE